MIDYRAKIYDKYVSGFRNTPLEVDENVYLRSGLAYGWYFRGWLPDRKDSSILDLGCGDGKLLFFYKRRGYLNIHGLDISEEQVNLARTIVPSVTLGNVLEFLKITDESYDFISAIDIIEHFTKDEAIFFLGKCFERLNENGRFILQTPNPCSLLGLSLRYSDITHETCFSPSLLRSLMRMVGFKNIEIREAGPIPYNYSLLSTVRCLLYKVAKLPLMAYQLIESGSRGEGIYTAVQLASGCKVKSE